MSVYESIEIKTKRDIMFFKFFVLMTVGGLPNGEKAKQ